MSNGWQMNSGLTGPAERHGLSHHVMLHCRTVVEKQNFVSTGIMTHVEGEFFEIELPEFHIFELGEAVKLTVYSPAGIQSFTSTVFAKYEGAIAVIQPPHLQKRFEEKREHPRVDAIGTVHISHVLDASDEPRPLETPVEVSLRDISISGLAFEAPDMPEISPAAKLLALVAIGFEFSCELEIVRRERQNGNILCGARMQMVDPEMMRPLRALILRQQVQRNVRLRKEQEEKKRFKN